jgi:hypothetical protein
MALMALDITKLEKMSGGNRSLFTYDAGADTVATVTASGYFNGATNNLKFKDVIIVIAGGGTTIDNVFVTSANFAATVTTSATEGVTAT